MPFITDSALLSVTLALAAPEHMLKTRAFMDFKSDTAYFGRTAFNLPEGFELRLDADSAPEVIPLADGSDVACIPAIKDTLTFVEVNKFLRLASYEHGNCRSDRRRQN